MTIKAIETVHKGYRFRRGEGYAKQGGALLIGLVSAPGGSLLSPLPNCAARRRRASGPAAATAALHALSNTLTWHLGTHKAVGAS
jgi:hypothetical protein